MPYAVFARMKGKKRYSRWDRKVYKTKKEAEEALKRIRKGLSPKAKRWWTSFKVAWVKG